MNIAVNDVGAAVLSNAVLVVPLAALVAVVCRFVKRPAVAWCLWGLVLVKFVTPAWYSCVQTPWSPTPGVSSGGSALSGVDQSLLSSDQQRLKHRVSSPANSRDFGSLSGDEHANHATSQFDTQSLPDEDGDELFAGHGAGVDVVEPTIGELAAADDDISDAGAAVVAPIDVSAEGAPPPPPLPVSNNVPDVVPVTIAEIGALPVERPAAESPAEALAHSKVGELAIGNDAGSRAMPRRSSASQEDVGRHAASAPIGGLTSPARRDVPLARRVVPVLVGVWAVGAVVLVVLAGRRVGRFRKLLRQAEPASEELVASARRLAARLGCRSVPALRVTSGRVPPVLWGLGRRAVILLPRGLLDELDDEQRSALLAHELAHFARRDHWTRWFEFAVRSLYWWHPVAWWAGRRLREAEEQCCDAWVVRLLPDSARRYADALLKTVDYLAAAPRSVPTLATGITLRRSLRPFHRRLTMILEHPPAPRLSWPARLCLLAVAAIVLPASVAAVDEDSRIDTAEVATTNTQRHEQNAGEEPSEAVVGPAADLPWQPFSEERLRALLVEGKPVVVHFTADWSALCKVNEKTVFNTKPTAQLLKQHGIVPLRADFTNEDREVKEWLDKFDNGAIPLTLIFSPSNSQHPTVLKGQLTQSSLLEHLKHVVISELAHAAELAQAAESAQAPAVRAGPGEEDTRVRVFRLQQVAAAEAVDLLRQLLGQESGRSQFEVDLRSNSIVFRGTEEQANEIEKLLMALDRPPQQAPAHSHTGETITVVRAQYVLPHNVAEAFDKFIQQHGEHFEFLVGKLATPSVPGGMGASMGMELEEHMGMGGYGRSTLGAARGFGMGAGMMGGIGGRRPRDTQSQLTIIATPEVQQHVGDFIRVLTEAPRQKQDPANGKGPETLTLVRAVYKLRSTPAATPEVRITDLDEFLSHLKGAADAVAEKVALEKYIQAQLDAAAARSRQIEGTTLGDAVLRLLLAVKKSNLVPLLLISADDDRLTVTTTENFQQQLGKFIHFLQEHESQGAGPPRSEGTSEIDRTGRAAELRQQEAVRRAEAKALLAEARHLLLAGQFERAREIALNAAKLSVTYDPFDDRPELVLADIAKAKAATGEKAKLARSDIEREIAGEWLQQWKWSGSRLSELRDQERELSALLSVIDESLKQEANRSLLLLAINQYYGDNAAGTALIEMFNKLVELETQKAELVQSHGVRHPSVMSVQQRIDTYRRSFGLPTGDDAKPLDLLDIYVQALKRQLDVTRKVIEALDKNQDQSAIPSGDRKRLESQIREAEISVAGLTELLQAIEAGMQAGGALEGARRAIAYLDSDAYRKHLQDLAGDDLDLVDRSIPLVKEFYELIQQQQELLQSRNLGPNHPVVLRVNSLIAEHLNSLGLIRYRDVHPTDYFTFMIEQTRSKLESSLLKLEALKAKRERR